MLKILNETTCLNDTNEIEKLAIIRFEKYLGVFKPSNNLYNLKLESDVYEPKIWSEKKHCDNILMSTSEVANSYYVAFKLETQCNVNMTNVVEYLSNVENITSYNHTIDSCNIIKNFKNNCCIYRITTPKMYGVNNRDFILYNNVYKLDDSTSYIYSISINNDSINKKYSKKNYVRGEIIITGFKVKKLTMNSCYITLLSHIEVNGSIPSLAVNNLINNDTVKVFKTCIANIEQNSL
jgi:hypothetical protein